MNVREVLSFQSFSGARIITGGEGLENEVTGAMVLEAVDIENWGKRGQLILTSFFALRDLTGDQLPALFDTMAKIGISAVVFKAERYLSSVPSDVVDICSTLGLPIIQVPKDCKYDSILFDVFGTIIDSHVEMLTRYYDMHQQTLRLELQRPSLLQVLRNLKHNIHSDVTYVDTLSNTHVSTKPDMGAFDSLSLEPREPGPYQAYKYFTCTIHYSSGRDANALAVQVPSPHKGERYLVIHDGTSEFGPMDVMVVENIVNLLQLEAFRREAESQRAFFERNSIVHDVLTERMSSHEDLAKMLSRLGMDSFPYYQVLLIRVELKGHSDTYGINDLMDAICRQVRSIYHNVVFYQSNNRIVFLRNCSKASAGFESQTIAGLLDELHKTSSLPDFVYLSMISQLAEREGIGAINSDVINMLKLFGANKSYDCCLDYEKLGAFKLFLQVANGSDLKDLVDQRVIKLYTENPELFSSAVLLCENGLNYSETARQLFLHPKTVHYRVGRIQQVYGIDLKNSDDRLQVLIADKVLVLVGGVGTEDADNG